MVQVLVFIEATLLTMIHNFRTSKPMSIGSETDPDRLYVWDCLLEMAHKYEMSEVSKEIAQDLSSQWPVTLRDWDIMVSTRRAIFGSKNVDHPSYRINYPEPAVAIAFCRRFELNPRSRAAALYALSTIPADQKWHKGQRARWHLLGLDDYRDLALISGLHRALCQMSFLETVQHCTGRSAKSSETCDLDACKAALALGALQSGDALEYLRLKVLDVNTGESLPEMCRQCSVYNRKRMEQERVRFWTDVSVCLSLSE